MSAYFDRAHASLDQLQARLRENPDLRLEGEIRQWEEKLVFDCTVAVYFPAFREVDPLPSTFQEAVNRTVIRFGVYTLPEGVMAEIETREDLFDRLHRLCGDLHTVFHSVVQETGRSDNPLAMLTRLSCEGYDDRDRLAQGAS
jgi:hypothetical protein